MPDLVIEIDLASGKNPGGQQRVVDYLEAGVRLVWTIDPRSRTGEALDGEEVVPGFALRLDELFV